MTQPKDAWLIEHEKWCSERQQETQRRLGVMEEQNRKIIWIMLGGMGSVAALLFALMLGGG